MRCLTVLEPWASGIVFGTKRIENRTWRTRYRGPLLIHAGRSRRYLDGTLPEDWQRLVPGLRSFDELRFGYVIGVVELIDCVAGAAVAGQLWAEGPWCWLLGSVQPIEPFVWTGQQRLFDVSHLGPHVTPS